MLSEAFNDFSQLIETPWSSIHHLHHSTSMGSSEQQLSQAPDWYFNGRGITRSSAHLA